MGEENECLPEAASQRLDKLNSNVVSSASHSNVTAPNQGSPKELGKGHSCHVLIPSRRNLLILYITPVEMETNRLLKVITVFLAPNMPRLVLFGDTWQ